MKKKPTYISSKMTLEDARLLGLIDDTIDKKKPTYKPIVHKYIYIPIDRKYLGMTQKERDAAKKFQIENKWGE